MFAKSCCFMDINRLMSSSGDDHDNGKPKHKLDLAKPGRAAAAKKRSRENIPKQEPSEEEKLNVDLVAAAKKVAGHMPGHSSIVESDLLQKLREHVTLTEAQRQGQIKKADVSDMFQGLKIEKRATRRRGGQNASSSNNRSIGHDRDSITSGILGRTSSLGTRERARPQTRDGARPDLANLRLYDGKPLDIFPVDPQARAVVKIETNLFDKLEQEEVQVATTFPAENAWEEAIRWTKEGKLWQFPINNEFGMDEEANVGFHEHVFLEHLLQPFPMKGPIRHFMELVVVGLSKNPYLTVQQKREHVEWFKEYFEDKYHIVEALIEDNTEARQHET